MSYTKKAVFGIVWMTLAGVISNIFGYLLRLFLARNLTVEEYGLIYAVFALFGLFSIFQGFGLSEAIVKYVSGFLLRKDKGKITEVIVWSALIMYGASIILALVIAFFADWLAIVYFNNPEAAVLVRLYAILFAISPLGLIVPQLFQAAQRIDIVALFSVVQSILLLGLTVLFIKQGMGMKGAVLAYVVFMVIQHILFLPLIKRFITTKVTFKFSTPKMLISYGFPVMLTGVGLAVLTFTDTILITLLSTLEQVAMYQVALPTANILRFFATVLGVVLFPIIAQMAERKLLKRIGVAVGDIYKYVLILMLPPIAAVVIYPELVLNLLFGAKYISGSTILQVLAVTVIFFTLNAVNVAALSGIGKPKQTTKAVWIGAVINLIGNVILIPMYGGLGAALSTFISTLFIVISSTYFLRREIPLILSWGNFLKTIVAAVLFLGVLTWTKGALGVGNQLMKVSLSILVSGIVYIGVVFLMKILTTTEIQRVKKLIFK